MSGFLCHAIMVLYFIVLFALSAYVSLYAYWLSERWNVKWYDYMLYAVYFMFSCIELSQKHYLIGILFAIPCIVFLFALVKNYTQHRRGGGTLAI